MRAGTRRTDSQSRVYVAENNKVRQAHRAKIISDLFPRLPHAISLFPGGRRGKFDPGLSPACASLDQLCVFGLLFHSYFPTEHRRGAARYFRRSALLRDRITRINLIRNYVLICRALSRCVRRPDNSAFRSLPRGFRVLILSVTRYMWKVTRYARTQLLSPWGKCWY